jgi:acyl dehydratase
MTVSWRIDEAAQHAFVELSGDRNPLHVDPLVARRLPFGRVAVHGLHIALAALDQLVSGTPLVPRHVTCRFARMVGIGDELDTRVGQISDDAAPACTVTVTRGGVAAVELTVELGPRPSPGAAGITPDGTARASSEPEVHALDELEHVSGSVTVVAGAAARTHFPRLAEAIGDTALAELVALTQVIGMHVPGLHSVFSGFDVAIGDGRPGVEPGHVDYRVVAVDQRFATVKLTIDASTLHGTLDAFVRPGPVEQHLGSVRPERGEFAGQRWLVVGGSRGLGAMAVLLLDAGGADVRFTYHRGGDDAHRLTARTAAAAHHLDVADLTGDLDGVCAGGWQPTHLAYMASPPIFAGERSNYSQPLFDSFRAVYVTHFLELVQAIDPRRLAAVLWPSSTAVTDTPRGMAEYADAKREGEAACAALAGRHPGLRVLAPRFPRLLTDQTTSFVPVEYGETDRELLAALRATG